MNREVLNAIAADIAALWREIEHLELTNPDSPELPSRRRAMWRLEKILDANRVA